MALAAVALLGLFVVGTFGRSDGDRRATLPSDAEVRAGRRLGGWLGLLVPLGLAGLAGLVSHLDPWLELAATWSLALAVLGIPLGRTAAPTALRYQALPPFAIVLGWAGSAAIVLALGSGILAAATGTSPFVVLYALLWVPVFTLGVTLPAAVVWVVLLAACRRPGAASIADEIVG